MTRTVFIFPSEFTQALGGLGGLVGGRESMG